MIQILYDMFASTAKRPTLQSFINWLVKLREPLPQNLQTPTAVALQYAGGHPQTQVRVSKAFNVAVKGDPSYSQCKAEDTKIISELIGSLGSVFYTLEAFDDFIKERRAQEEIVTRQVTAPLGEFKGDGNARINHLCSILHVNRAQPFRMGTCGMTPDCIL